MAQSPVVLIGGAAATMLKGRGSLQDIDQLSVLKPIVKYAATCTSVRQIVPTLRKAFQQAMSGVPGPVFVEFPLDVLYPISGTTLTTTTTPSSTTISHPLPPPPLSVTEIRASMGMSVRMRRKEIKMEDGMLKRVIVPDEAVHKGLTQRAYVESLGPEKPVFLKAEAGSSKQPWVVDKYMQYKLSNLFAGAFDKTDVSPLPIRVPLPSSRDLRAASVLLAKAEHPVLLLGSQVHQCCAAPAALSARRSC